MNKTLGVLIIIVTALIQIEVQNIAKDIKALQKQVADLQQQQIEELS